MNSRQLRLADTFDNIGGPVARLRCSLREDAAAVATPSDQQTGLQMLATDAFLQRFQQVTDLVLRKLFPRILAVMEHDEERHPFGAMLDRLDGFAVLGDVPWWIDLNRLRNRLIHEYAMSVEVRQRELADAWQSATRLIAEIDRIRNDPDLAKKLNFDV